MIWNVLFWLSLASLAVIIIYKIVWPALAGGDSKSRDQASRMSPGWWISLAVAVLLVAVSFWFMNGLSGGAIEFSAEEKVSVTAFAEAMDYYDQATEISTEEKTKVNEDWETVRALLAAALDLTEPLPDDALNRIHPELAEHVRTNFVPGLHAGIYGLALYTSSTPKDLIKGTGTGTYPETDSLEVGTELLTRWKTWYDSNRPAIEAALAQVE